MFLFGSFRLSLFCRSSRSGHISINATSVKINCKPNPTSETIFCYLNRCYVKDRTSTTEPRGVTRLDGARAKSRFGAPMLEPEVFRWENVLYWRKSLWHCWDFSAHPAVVRRPHSDSAPGELCPLCPPSYAPGWTRFISERRNCRECVLVKYIRTSSCYLQNCFFLSFFPKLVIDRQLILFIWSTKWSWI